MITLEKNFPPGGSCEVSLVQQNALPPNRRTLNLVIHKHYDQTDIEAQNKNDPLLRHASLKVEFYENKDGNLCPRWLNDSYCLTRNMCEGLCMQDHSHRSIASA